MALATTWGLLLSAASSPVPTGNPGEWATTIDYPPAAIFNRQEGIVAFNLEVNGDGRPSQCTIVESSGHPVLDTKTCELMMDRARFTAAAGERYTDNNVYQNRVSWNLPPIDFDLNALLSKKDGFCGFGLSLNGPGPTKISLVQNRNLFNRNRILVAILNDAWAITRSDKIADTIKVAAEKRSFWNQPQAIDNGFLLVMDPAHTKSFAESNPRTAAIYKGKIKIGQIDMRDFRTRYRELENCSKGEHQ